MADQNHNSSTPRETPARHGAEPTEALERARARLVDAEARLRAILDTAVDGIITIDEAGVIDSVNAATERLFGYSADELVGSNVSRLMPDHDRDRHDGYIRSYLRTGERKIIDIGREVQGRHRDGSRIPLDLAVSEMRVGEKRLFTGIVRDISARRRAEEQARRRLEELAHAARLSTLGELTTGIAHEVNQPLAAIVSFAEACLRMLRSENATREKLEGALEQIVVQGQRAGQIVHHLRRMARKGDSVREPVDLNILVGDVLPLMGDELASRDVAVQLTLAEGLPRVSCNRIQIEQVVINLLRNAMESVASRPAGDRSIRVGTRLREGPAVQLSVEDNGQGLAAGEVERIFETFYTTKSEGLGMGLSVSRSIVEDHGGRLWAASGSEGGAVFHVQLDAEVAR